MFLFKARQAAEEELSRTYSECGVTEAEVRAFLKANPKYASPLHVPPHTSPCTAASLVREVAPLIRQTRLERMTRRVTGGAARTRALLERGPAAARSAVRFVRSPENRAQAIEDVRLVGEVLRGRAGTTLKPLFERMGAGSLVSP
jgi:hypothetical protein